MKTLATFAAFLITLPAAADLYKCKDAEGKTTYSEMPCKGASMTRINIKKEVVDTEGAMARLEKDRTYLAEQRKKSEIDDIFRRIDAMQRQKNGLFADMDNDLNNLRNRKQFSRNNLAGATWEQSISTEMQAVTNRYQTEINVVDGNIAQARREIERLKESKPQ